MYLCQLSSLALLPSVVVAIRKRVRFFRWAIPAVLGISLVFHHKPFQSRRLRAIDVGVNHPVIAAHILRLGCLSDEHLKYLYSVTAFMYSLYVYYIGKGAQRNDWLHASIHFALGSASFLIVQKLARC